MIEEGEIGLNFQVKRKIRQKITAAAVATPAWIDTWIDICKNADRAIAVRKLNWTMC